jgi:hypothetical protein
MAAYGENPMAAVTRAPPGIDGSCTVRDERGTLAPTWSEDTDATGARSANATPASALFLVQLEHGRASGPLELTARRPGLMASARGTDDRGSIAPANAPRANVRQPGLIGSPCHLVAPFLFPPVPTRHVRRNYGATLDLAW